MQKGEVHVWFVRSDQALDASIVSSWEMLLDAQEKNRLERFSFEPGKREFLVGRALLRNLLSRYNTKVSPQEWVFEEGPHGRPEIRSPKTPIRFNLSHSHGLVACAFARDREIGVDVESLDRRTDIESVAAGVFSDAEMTELKKEPEGPARAEKFFRFWTLKEAYLKARGLGLRISLPGVSFQLEAGESARVGLAPEIQDRSEDWQFALMSPTPEHRAAVAVRRGADAPLKILEHWWDGKAYQR